MSKKRGLSLEEKKKCVLDIFHETKEVFSFKDIEKLAPKRGVTLQSVKDVVQALVDDDLVHQEKIGSSNFYWSFPSEAAVKLETGIETAKVRAEQQRKEMESLEAQLRDSSVGKEDSEERRLRVHELSAVEAELAAKTAELAKYADNDPERHKDLQEGAQLARDAANRWLDNIEMLRKWLRQRFQGQEQQLDSFLSENGYKEDMEYFN